MKTHKPFDRKNNTIFKDTKGKEYYLDGENDRQTLKPVPKQMTRKEMIEKIDRLNEDNKRLCREGCRIIDERDELKMIVKQLEKKDGELRLGNNLLNERKPLFVSGHIPPVITTDDSIGFSFIEILIITRILFSTIFTLYTLATHFIA